MKPQAAHAALGLFFNTTVTYPP